MEKPSLLSESRQGGVVDSQKAVQCQKSSVAWAGGPGEGAAPLTGRDAEP